MDESTHAARLAQIAMVMNDPPAVHEAAPRGVWRTAPSCYEFLADMTPRDAVTLETGLGMSTVLFSLWSRHHVCVVSSDDEVDRLRRYADEHALDLTSVHFQVGSSDQLLPLLQIEPVDLYFIDGGHGFPQPSIDWYYGSMLLRPGGVVVVDDIQLPSVNDYLVRFLRADDRWHAVGGDGYKWIGFRKEGNFSVREEWTEQAFLGRPRRLPLKTRGKIAVYRRLSKLKPRAR